MQLPLSISINQSLVLPVAVVVVAVVTGRWDGVNGKNMAVRVNTCQFGFGKEEDDLNVLFGSNGVEERRRYDATMDVN